MVSLGSHVNPEGGERLVWTARNVDQHMDPTRVDPTRQIQAGPFWGCLRQPGRGCSQEIRKRSFRKLGPILQGQVQGKPPKAREGSENHSGGP